MYENTTIKKINNTKNVWINSVSNIIKFKHKLAGNLYNYAFYTKMKIFKIFYGD